MVGNEEDQVLVLPKIFDRSRCVGGVPSIERESKVKPLSVMTELFLYSLNDMRGKGSGENVDSGLS